MKRLLLTLLFILSSFGLLAADINLTNIAAAAGSSLTDKVLGVTNVNYSALIPISQIVQLATNGYAWTNLTVAHGAALTNGYPWTNVSYVQAQGITNAWPWTNLTVTHAGAVTNGFPWTNIAANWINAAVTNGLAGTNWVGNYFTITNDTRVLKFTNDANLFAGDGTGLTNLQTALRLQSIITNITTSCTLDPNVTVVTVDTTAASITVTLPSACPEGYYLQIKSIGNNPLYIDASPGQTIDGASSITLSTKYQARTIYRVGTNWLLF